MSWPRTPSSTATVPGFDWAFHQYDTVGADDDMEINNTWSAFRSRSSSTATVGRKLKPTRQRLQRRHPRYFGGSGDDRRSRVHRLRRTRRGWSRPHRGLEALVTPAMLTTRHQRWRPSGRRTMPTVRQHLGDGDILIGGAAATRS
jgi:hypothetical protein